MSTEENKALVRRTFEGFNKKNPNVEDEFFAPDSLIHFPGVPQPLGLDAQKQLNAMYFSAFPDVHFTEQDLIAEGDRVVARWSISMTHKGEFQGIPPTGKQVTLTSIDIFRITGGKIAEQWTEYDSMSLLQQLGVAPAPGQAS